MPLLSPNLQSIGVYSRDIVFLDSLNENIKRQIDRDGIEIYILSY